MRGIRIGMATSAFALAACGVTPPSRERASVAPAQAAQAGTGFASFQPLEVKPMYREVLPIDLATTVQTALAQNLDIQLARQRVNRNEGRLQSTYWALFPVLSLSGQYEDVDGRARATSGEIVDVNFSGFQLLGAVESILNVPQTVSDIVAARKRLLAEHYSEHGTEAYVLHKAVNQYYDLLLAKSHLALAHQTLGNTEERANIIRAKVDAGAAIPADIAQTKAELARERMNILVAVANLYEASVTLAQTLHLDATITLVPDVAEVRESVVVDTRYTIDELLSIALANRDDLHVARELLEAAQADSGGVLWGTAAPMLYTGVSEGGVGGTFENKDSGSSKSFDLSGRRALNAGVSWNLAMSLFGDLQAAEAEEAMAATRVEMALDHAKTEVIQADQKSKAYAARIAQSLEGVEAVKETLRVAEAGERIGTKTRLDVIAASAELARVENSHAEIICRRNQSQIDLLAALGAFDAKALGVPVSRNDAR